jgi:hypothetical protein
MYRCSASPQKQLSCSGLLEEVDPFFEGTWMKGFGILYLDQNQEPHRISILLDPAADRLSKQPFTAAFDGVPLTDLDVSARSAPFSFH